MMAAMMAVAALTGYSGGTEETTVAPTAAKTTAKATQASAAGEGTEAESLIGRTVAAQTGESAEILVTAAASPRNAYGNGLIPVFQERYPGVVVKGTYDSSGRLQMQIEEGLRADVFVSVATEQMTALNEESMIESDTVTNLLKGKIVFIIPVGSSAGSEKSGDIKKTESITLGDPASVPAEQYTQKILTSLSIWDKIQDKVSFGINVTEVLNRVVASSADADIVYATDVAGMTDQMQVVAEAPEGSLGEKIIYPVTVMKNTAHAEEVRSSVEFPKTDKAMKVLEEYRLMKGE